MKRRLLLAAPAALVLSACGPDAGSSSLPALPAGSTLATPSALADHVSGFSVGALTAREAVYVFFDMQCPHCATLWAAAKPLWQDSSRLRFVWVPVAVLNRASLAQGATILASQDPSVAMDEHKASLLARRGGMSADSAALERFGERVRRNSDVLRAMDVQSVPHLVARHAVTGQVVTRTGALPTEQLRELLGV